MKTRRRIYHRPRNLAYCKKHMRPMTKKQVEEHECKEKRCHHYLKIQ